MPSAISPNLDHSKLSKEDAADLASINSTLDRMRHFLPDEPYVLTVPQPYADKETVYEHPHRYAASQWLYGAPFDRNNEWEGLQYQTWEYHGAMHPVYEQRTHEELRSSQKSVVEAKVKTPLTGASTPTPAGGAKKVYSFNAYKKKQGGTPIHDDATAKKAEDAKKREAVKGPIERVKAEADEVLAAAKEVQEQDARLQEALENEKKEKKKDEQENQNMDLKRKRTDSQQVNPDKPSDGTQKAPPAKKARTSPMLPSSPPRSSPPAEVAKAEQSQRKNPGLSGKEPLTVQKPKTTVPEASDKMMPPKLSPLRATPALPSRLSPTIPQNMEESLKQRIKTENGSSPVAAAPTSAKPRRRLLVKLKVGKGVRDRVHKLPKTPPLPQKIELSDSAIRRNDERREAGVKGVAQKVGLSTPSRPKKKQEDTPTVQSGTPVGLQPRPPSSQAAEKTPMQAAWEKERARLQNLGRELKHTAQDYMKARSPTSKSDSSAPTKQQILAAATALECFLTFMLNFVAADEAVGAADPRGPPVYKNWETLYAFFSFVKSLCRPVPLLEAVTSMMGVSALARLLEIGSSLREDRGPKRDDLVKFVRRMQSAAVDAEARLDVNRLQEVFPKTWAARDRRRTSEDDKLRPGEFGGLFKLPIGIQTSPLIAARAGYSMLQEWIEKEGLEHKLKLKL